MTISALSTPIIDVWEGVVTLPLVGVIDTQRAVEMTERLLARIVESGARAVIIDLTGVEVVDTATADHLVRLTRAAGLLGARCFVTGIGPNIARTLVGMGVDLGGVRTMRTLKEALRACIDEGAAAPRQQSRDRDADALTWLRRRSRRPRIGRELAGARHAVATRLHRPVEVAAHPRTQVLDVTSELGVPRRAKARQVVGQRDELAYARVELLLGQCHRVGPVAPTALVLQHHHQVVDIALGDLLGQRRQIVGPAHHVVAHDGERRDVGVVEHLVIEHELFADLDELDRRLHGTGGPAHVNVLLQPGRAAGRAVAGLPQAALEVGLDGGGKASLPRRPGHREDARHEIVQRDRERGIGGIDRPAAQHRHEPRIES
ncbi:MAG: STAS domain-containing protein [Deltaproteobacteria bacterium]|nr:STAS domain-containing protein [Deltaproteobacteria bacterium]